jgi:hypothetical protein
MISTIVSTREFRVTIDAFDINGDTKFTANALDLSFMQAGDYAEKAVDHFRFEIMQHSDWVTVQVEIMNRDSCLELIEIKRETV